MVAFSCLPFSTTPLERFCSALFHSKQPGQAVREIVGSLDETNSSGTNRGDIVMRKLIISAAVAALAAVSFATPSLAGGHGYHGHHGHHRGGFSIGFFDTGYYGGGYYGSGYYEPSCYIKKVKRWDKWGNLRIKKIKICD
jgi:hypothetical protein